MSKDNIYFTAALVKRWLGNPLTRSLLGFIASSDSCGDRLSIAIDSYTGAEIEACWRCRLAGRMVKEVLHRSSNLFGVDEEEVKAGLKFPIFKRGLVSVLKGITHYGVSRPQLVEAPFLVVWDLTHLCNLRCKHCYQDAHKALPEELSTGEALALVDDLSQAGVAILAFSGGEPLMRGDFFEIAEHAMDKGIYVSLASNGTLITPDVAAQLHDIGIEYVEISLDGKDAEKHDSLRGVDGAFEKSTAGIRNCVAAGIYTCVATTITQENHRDLPEIYSLARKLGAGRFMNFNFIPTGRGLELMDKDLTPGQREEVLRFLLKMNGEPNSPEALSTAPQFARVAVENGGEGIPVGHFRLGNELRGQAGTLAEFIGGCGAGRLYCSIEPSGNVQPCVFLPIVVGNVRETAFIEIWKGSEVLIHLRKRLELKGACANCENKNLCGGCRARAWAYYADLDAPDPGCIKNKSYWSEIRESCQAKV
jgi:radical SAM protein with 4Fe4S-binding SPASM domain